MSKNVFVSYALSVMRVRTDEKIVPVFTNDRRRYWRFLFDRARGRTRNSFWKRLIHFSTFFFFL